MKPPGIVATCTADTIMANRLRPLPVGSCLQKKRWLDRPRRPNESVLGEPRRSSPTSSVSCRARWREDPQRRSERPLLLITGLHRILRARDISSLPLNETLTQGSSEY